MNDLGCGRDFFRAFVVSGLVSICIVLGAGLPDRFVMGWPRFGILEHAVLAVVASIAVTLLAPWVYAMLSGQRGAMFVSRLRTRAVWNGRLLGLMTGVWIGLSIAPYIG
ncbi:hypothetical protein [Burkholderia ubonensis]|uniref:hypothetical protein n=1 Tax=Burkholderia ubonensis TaxID=101571 RepID=UPI0012FCF9D9|nr:hypothetical protein [Burkholderia ubonensis]